MERRHVSARLETEALVIGYAMSRLDQQYLAVRGCATWQDAFREAADALHVPPASVKNLRDEFDPFHPNRRSGWHHRQLRPSRLRVLIELQDTSEQALLGLVERILARDEEAIGEAVDSLVTPPRTAHNVAERLLTGRRAEEYFLQHSRGILDICPMDIIDYRYAARGFDFGVRTQPSAAIEVKGLKQMTGGILFTDREWCEAMCRGRDYCLVIVGNLADEPVVRVVFDPCSEISAECHHRQTVTASWYARISV